MQNEVIHTAENQTNSLIENEFEQLKITPESEAYLRTTTKWSLFLAIVGFIGMGFMLIGGFFMMGISGLVGEYQDFQALPIPQIYIGLGIMYIILAVLYFFPLYYLLLFANKTKQALNLRNQQQLDEGFKNMKRFAKFVGILTIVLLAFSVVVIPIITVVFTLSKGLGGAGVGM